MSKTGLVLVVLYLLSSPVNLQQTEDDKAFMKIMIPTLTRVLERSGSCVPKSGGGCTGTCPGTCEGSIKGCACKTTG
uniref:Conotoxin n=1 Tax=Conus andremenezi TaxID=1077466 RepID=A0A291C245_9COND|nr:conotoxin [Conus andremenezi]